MVVLLSSTFLSGCLVNPQPLTDQEISQSVNTRYEDATSGQVPVKGSIDLAEAMARAVLYNLDDRVQQAESLLRSRELLTANAAMLPNLVATAKREGRNEIEASSSLNLKSNTLNFDGSTSQDQRINSANANLSWNVIDLGLSYVRAKQAADKVLAAQERRRSVLAKLVEDVRTAYWRALAAENLARELPKMEARVRATLEQSRTLVRDGNVSPMTALSYQKEIFETLDRVQTIQGEVVASRATLANLMNLPPGTQFSLVRPKVEVPPLALPDQKKMLLTALEYRPEVRQYLYQERVDGRESIIAILETLPSVNLFLTPNSTSNSYTLNKEWLGWGAQASWNLMKVFNLPLRQGEANAKQELSLEKTKALVSTVALQVAISRERYFHARRRLQTASDFRSVQQDLLKQLAASTTAARSSEQDLVREELSTLLAQARYDVSLAEVQAAFATVQTTMGFDPYPALDSDDLDDLKMAFRAKLSGKPANLKLNIPKPQAKAAVELEDPIEVADVSGVQND